MTASHLRAAGTIVRSVKFRTALCSIPLLAVLNGCSNEEPPSAVPAPPATPIIEPVDGVVVQSELDRAVKAMEDHRNAEGTYTQSPGALADHGFVSSEVLILVPYADDRRYCIEATSSTDSDVVFAASDAAPAPRRGGCPDG